MNFTNHSIERWVYRIIGITDEATMNLYRNENLEMIKSHMEKTFSYAKFIWKGQLGDNITRQFYIHNDIIFVVNTDGSAIVTVYKVDFGFSDSINLDIAVNLLKEVEELTERKYTKDFANQEEIERLNNSIEDKDEEIKSAKKLLKSLEEEKLALSNLKAAVIERTTEVDMSLKKSVNQLVNSLHYKNDLKANFK